MREFIFQLQRFGYYIYNAESDTLVSGTDDDDTIKNGGENEEEGANGEWDYGGTNVTISGGAGYDEIYSYGDSVTIDGGDDADYIYNDQGREVSINGGADNDDIYNYFGDNATIVGGKGNDYIINEYENYYEYSNNVLFQYAEGDGNDYIEGFNASSTLQITSGTVKDMTSNGENIFVAVGEGTITLAGAQGLDSLNVFNSDGSQAYVNVINLTDRATSLDNYFSNTTINCGAGNDTIYNDGSYVTINAGAGNDSIKSWGTPVTVDGGTGNDSVIIEWGGLNSIIGGAGNDFISVDGYAKIIDGGEDDDIIVNNYGSITSIIGGAGNDSIYFYSGNLTINGGVGNDLIYSTGGYGSYALIGYAYGDGNDTLMGFKYGEVQLLTDSKTAINMSGNDVILAVDDTAEAITFKDMLSDDTASIKIFSKDGDELSNYTFDKNNGIITNGSDSVTLISSFNGSIDVSNYSNVDASSVNAKVTLESGKTNSITLIGGKADDSIQTFTANSSLVGGAGNDTITNKTSYSEIVTRQVTETLRVEEPTGYYTTETVTTTIASSKNVTVTLTGWHNERVRKEREVYRYGAGGTTIKEWEIYYEDESVYGDYETVKSVPVTLETTTTKQVFHKTGTKWVTKTNTKTVTGPVERQTYNTNTTISGGAGDDYIINEAANFVYYYALGDGNDTIDGFNEESKLSISGGDYSASASGNDVILKVGDGSITLKDTKGKVLNINDKETFNPSWTLNGTTANYGTEIEALITVNGVKSLDGLTLDGSTVTVAKSALNQETVTISDGYYLALANDVQAPTTTAAGWNLSGTTATYKAASTSAGYTLSNNQISYVATSGGNTLATVSGVKSTDGLALKDKVVTVSKAALGTDKVTVSEGYTLALADDVTKTSTTAAGWTLNNSIATYKNSATSAGYKLSNNQISYVATSGGNTLATVSGVKSTDGLTLNDKVVTVSAKALGTDKVTISDGYTLALADDVTKTSTTAAGWTLNNSIATYKNSATSAGYKLSNNQISYVAASGGNTLATVSGVKSTDGLTLNDKVVTVSKAALGTDKVTISEGYTLALADDVTKTSTTAAGWTLNNSIATYKNSATSAGYKLSNNQISYVAASGGNTLATVSGVKSTDGLTLNDKVVTVSKAALGTDKVTISDGYTLALADDVTKTSTTAAGWTLNNSIATYKNSATSAGYKLSNNQISYVAASGDETLATVSGVKSTDGLTLNDKVVTVSAKALGTDKVTISDGYTLKLASDVSKPSTSKAWTLKKTTATYKQTISKGYTLANNAISYAKESSATLATVKGVKATDGLKVSGKKITVSKSALGTSKVTVSGGYTLKLGSDVTKSKTTKAWSLDKTTATYKQTTAAGYKLADNAITYTKSATKTLATVDGVKSTKDISAKNNVVTLKASSLNKKVTVNGSGYEFNFASGDYKKTSITGGNKADVITARGKNISIDGGAGADTINLLGSATTVNGGKGNDIISGNGKGNYSLWGGAGNDTLYSSSGADKFFYAKGDGKDVILGFDDKDTLTLDNLDFTASYKNKAVTFKVDGGSVTLKDFTATTFHVNNDTYKISGSKLKKQ